MTLAQPERLLRVREVAERLRWSEGHTRRVIASGELRHVRIGLKTIRVTEADLETFINRRNPTPATIADPRRGKRRRAAL